MTKRVLAVAAAGVAAAAAAAAAVVWAGTPASAQTYPPPVRSITVDDTTPAPGQTITISLRTCRPGTIALLGIDLKLVATPRVGADRVARASVTVPSRLRPGRHTVSGACLTPELQPLFLTTVIDVTGRGGSGGAGGGSPAAGGTAPTPPAAPPAPAGAGGPASGVAPGPAAGGSGAAPGSSGAAPGGSGAAPGGSGVASSSSRAASSGSGSGPAAPSLGGLAGSDVPADAADLFGNAAAAGGITAEGVTPGGDGLATAQRSEATDAATGDSDPGLLATIARVTLGVAALGGVPVALAISPRPRRTVRRGFAI
jgi:hypothetical protein